MELTFQIASLIYVNPEKLLIHIELERRKGKFFVCFFWEQKHEYKAIFVSEPFAGDEEEVAGEVEKTLVSICEVIEKDLPGKNSLRGVLREVNPDKDPGNFLNQELVKMIVSELRRVGNVKVSELLAQA